MSQNLIDVVAQLQVQGLDAAAQQINATLGNRKVNVGVNIPTAGIQQLQSLSSNLLSLNATLQKINAASRGTSYSLGQISPASAAASAGLQQLSNQGRTTQATMGSLAASLNQGSDALNSFGFQAGLSLRRFTAFTLAAGSMIRLTQGFTEGIRQGIEFQHQMVRISQVSGDSSARIKELAQRIGEISVGFGVSSRDVTQAAVVFKQAGLSIKDTEIALNALAKAAVAPNFDSMAQTAEGAIAVMAQFKVGAEGLEGALGSMNAVAGEFAVEASDLITLVQKTGGAFKTAGGDLNELLGLFTAVRSTTRESADQIATGLRTIFGRLQRNEVVQSLKEMQIELRHTAAEAEALGNPKLVNQFVGPFEAFRRLSQGLANIPTTDPKYSGIVEQIGGSRQLSRVIPAIQEFATAQKALQVAQAGSISLSLAQEKAEASLQLRVTQSKEKFLELFRTITSDKSFDSFLRGTLAITDAITDLVGALKPLIPLLGGVAAASFVRGISGGVTGYFSKGLFQGGAHKYADGGLVPGVGNTDSIPAMVMPGEFIFTKQSVRNIGVDHLRELESRGRSGGGVRLRGYANGGLVRHYADGDEVKPRSDFEKRFLSLSNSSEQQAFLFPNGGGSTHPDLEKLLKQITSKSSSPEDASQDALLRVLQKFASGDSGFDPEKGSLESFLAKIAQSTSSNQGRANRGNRSNSKVTSIGSIDGLMDLINQIQAGQSVEDDAPHAALARSIAERGKALTLTPETKIQTKNLKSGGLRFAGFGNLLPGSLTNAEGGDVDIASGASYGRDPAIIAEMQEELAQAQAQKRALANVLASLPENKVSGAIAPFFDKTAQGMGNTAIVKDGVKGDSELAEMIRGARAAREAGVRQPLPATTNARARMEGGGGLRGLLKKTTNTGNGNELAPGLVEGRDPTPTPSAPDINFADGTYNILSPEQHAADARRRAAQQRSRAVNANSSVTAPETYGFESQRDADARAGGYYNLDANPEETGRAAVASYRVARGEARQRERDTFGVPSPIQFSNGDDGARVAAINFQAISRSERAAANARNGINQGGFELNASTDLASFPRPTSDDSALYHQRLQQYAASGDGGVPSSIALSPPDEPSGARRRENLGLVDIIRSRSDRQTDKVTLDNGGRDVLSQQTQSAIGNNALNQQLERSMRELTGAQERLVKVLFPRITAEEAHKIATEQSAEALKTNAKVVRDSSGRILGLQSSIAQVQNAADPRTGALLNPNFTPRSNNGFFGTLGGIFSGRGAGASSSGLGSKFTNFFNGPQGQFAQIAALSAVPLLADQVSKFGGTAEQAVVGNRTAAFRGSQGFAGAASYGVTGAFVGAQLGSVVPGLGTAAGAGIGLAAGALYGLVTALQQAEKSIKEIKFNDALATAVNHIGVLSSIKGQVAPTSVNETLDSVRNVRKLSADSNKLDSTGFFNGGQLDVASFEARQGKSARTDFGGSLPQIVGVLANQAEDIGRANVGGKVEDLAKTLSQGNNGLNRELLEIVAQIRGISVGTVLKEFERNIKAAQDTKLITDRTKASGFAEVDSIGAFGRLALSAQAAADAMRKFGQQAESVVDRFHGRVGNTHVDLNSDNLNQFGRNDGGVLQTLGTIRSIGGEQGDRLFRHGTALNNVANLLPGILGDVAGSGKDGADASDAIRSQLTKSLGFKPGQAPKEVQDVIAQLLHQFDSQTGGKPGAFRDKVQSDSTTFAKDLLQPQTSSVQQSGKAILDAAQANLNTYIDRLTQSTGLSGEIRQTQSRGDIARLQNSTVRNQFAADNRGDGRRAVDFLSLNQLEEPQRLRLERLGRGLGNRSAEDIGGDLRSRNEQIAALQERQQSESQTNPQAAAQTALELKKVEEEASKLQEALRLLADGSHNAAAAQQKLTSLQQERGTRLGTAASFYTSSPQERAQITRDARLTASAAGRGTLNGFSAQDQSRIVGFLQRNSGITTGVKDENGSTLSTDALLEKLLKNSAGGGLLNKGQESEIKSLQNAIVNKFDTAEKAIEELAKTQENESTKFFTLLSQAQESFFSRLAGSLTKDAVDDKKRDLGRAQIESGDVKKQLDSANGLRKFGITDANLGNAATRQFTDKLGELQAAKTALEDLKNGSDATIKQSGSVDLSGIAAFDSEGANQVAKSRRSDGFSGAYAKYARGQIEKAGVDVTGDERAAIANRFGILHSKDDPSEKLNPEQREQQLRDRLNQAIRDVKAGSVNADGTTKLDKDGKPVSKETDIRTRQTKALDALGATNGIDRRALLGSSSKDLGDIKETLEEFSKTGKSIEDLNKKFEDLGKTIQTLKEDIRKSQEAPPVETSTASLPANVSRPLNVSQRNVGDVILARAGQSESLGIPDSISSPKIGSPEQAAKIKADLDLRKQRFDEIQQSARAHDSVRARSSELTQTLAAQNGRQPRTPGEALDALRASDGTGSVGGRTRASREAAERRLQKRLANQKPSSQSSDSDSSVIAKYDAVNRGDFNAAGALSRIEDPFASFNAGHPDFGTQAQIGGRQLSLIQQYNQQRQAEDPRLQDARNRRSAEKYKLPLQPGSGAAAGAGVAQFSIPPEPVNPLTGVPAPSPQNPRSQGQVGGLSQTQLSTLTNGFTTFGRDVQMLSDSFSKFSSSAEALAEAIGKMPSTLQVSGTQEVVVHHVGADALATMEPVFKEWIATGTEQAVSRAFKERLPDVGPSTV